MAANPANALAACTRAEAPSPGLLPRPQALKSSRVRSIPRPPLRRFTVSFPLWPPPRFRTDRLTCLPTNLMPYKTKPKRNLPHKEVKVPNNSNPPGSQALSATSPGTNHPAYHIPDRSRYIGAYDDTDSPSSFTGTTIPSSRAVSLTQHTIARLEMEALADWHRANRRNRRAGGGRVRTALDEREGPPTPSDISHSSTIVCHGSEAGSRAGSQFSRFSAGAVMGGVGAVHGAGSGMEEDRRRENIRECATEAAMEANGGMAGVNRRTSRRGGQ